MTKSHAHGRRRADVPRTNSLQAISQAVASNAGSVGRQAAVVAAASGLIVTLGVPGQATAPRDVSASPVDTINPERVAVKAVKVAADKKADIAIERASFTAEEKPEPVVIAVSNDITPTTRSNNSGSSDSMAPMTRQSRSGGQESAPQQKAQPKAETTVQSSNLSGIAATAAKYVGVPYVWAATVQAAGIAPASSSTFTHSTASTLLAAPRLSSDPASLFAPATLSQATWYSRMVAATLASTWAAAR